MAGAAGFEPANAGTKIHPRQNGATRNPCDYMGLNKLPRPPVSVKKKAGHKSGHGTTVFRSPITALCPVTRDQEITVFDRQAGNTNFLPNLLLQ